MNNINDMTRHEEMYLEYCNDFISLEKFAEHHSITPSYALSILIVGRRENHNRKYNKL